MLIKNIKQLVGVNVTDVKRGKAMQQLECIDDAWLLIEEGIISDFGRMQSIDDVEQHMWHFEVLDVTGKLVLPCYCDSHTHLVYASSREAEFVDRINGMSYEEIAARGGGILNSAHRLRAASEEELFESAWYRLEEIMLAGTGAVEIKSGYGLDAENELKMLRVIKKLKDESAFKIKSTFLGAHAYVNGV